MLLKLARQANDLVPDAVNRPPIHPVICLVCMFSVEEVWKQGVMHYCMLAHIPSYVGWVCPMFCTSSQYICLPSLAFQHLYIPPCIYVHGHANMHIDVLVDFFEANFGNIEDSPIEVILTLSVPIATDLNVRVRMMNLTQVFELTEGEVARRRIPLPDDFPDPGVFSSRRPYIASSECPELMIGMA